MLFVGEALAGNDSVDQLTLFNKALQDFSVQKEVRGIDGIILTKVRISEALFLLA